MWPFTSQEQRERRRQIADLNERLSILKASKQSGDYWAAATISPEQQAARHAALNAEIKSIESQIASLMGPNN